MEIIVGNLKSKILSDNPELLTKLSALYSFYEPGHKYSTAYKRHSWDGKKHFISRNTFNSGLLSTILKDLERIECIPTLTYTESSDFSYESPLVESFTYYDYQEELISKALEAHRGIIKSPTGSGKTLIIAGIVKALENRKGVILFSTKQILTQTYEFLKNCGIQNLGICFGEGFIQGDIMLSTVQSIESILDTHLHEAEFLIVDEVHEFANGKSRLAAINSFPSAIFRFGFTATVPSDPIPKHNLLGAFGSVITAKDTQELIGESKLTRPEIQIISLPEVDNELEDTTYREQYEEYIVDNDYRNNKILEITNFIKESNEKARILILVRDLRHGELLERLLPGDTFYLRGDDDISERYSTIKKFVHSGQASILIGTRILQTGVNIKEITHFINARGLKSPIATIQALGRALRLSENKDVVYVYDFLDRPQYLNAHSKKRIQAYKEEGHKVVIIE